VSLQLEAWPEDVELITMSDVSSRLQFALSMASAASDLILQHYQVDGLLVESKSDDSPVTVADRGAEQLIRKMLVESFPQDGILGEEFDSVSSQNGYRWIIDPIDGTKPFVHGVPLFGTLIGIELDSRMVAGVCRFPALNEVVYAAEGQGCWWQIRDQAPRQTFVSSITSISEARMMFTEPTHWRTTGRFDSIVAVMNRVKVARGWGDCYGHAMVATGRAEMAIDPLMSPWDIAALIPILREAGGTCTDWKGIETVTGGDGVSVVPALKDAVLSVLKNAPTLK
jgi:histidinol-phosphatase